MPPEKRYPKRSAFFAHNYTRIICKTCAAQDIQAEGVWLCVMIAHLEDTKRYMGPVTFFNEQLLPLLGIGKVDRLDKIRKAAVEAGWLHYEPPGRGIRKAGNYWVTIPEHLDGVTGEFGDEGLWELEQYKLGFEAGVKSVSKELIPQIGGSIADQPGVQSQINADSTGVTIYPNPNPNPNPIHTSDSPEVVSAEFAEYRANPLVYELAFIERWNSSSGRTLYRKKALSAQLSRILTERLADVDWDWRAAMDKFPLAQFPADGTWVPNIDWFLKPDAVRKILDGNYDKPIGGKPANRPGPGQRYDPQFGGDTTF